MKMKEKKKNTLVPLTYKIWGKQNPYVNQTYIEKNCKIREEEEDMCITPYSPHTCTLENANKNKMGAVPKSILGLYYSCYLLCRKNQI